MLNLIYKICKYKELNADTIFYACKEDIPILEKNSRKDNFRFERTRILNRKQTKYNYL